MNGIGDWLIPLLAVVALAGITLLFAGYIGKWIDAQGNAPSDKPRENGKAGTNGNKGRTD